MHVVASPDEGRHVYAFAGNHPAADSGIREGKRPAGAFDARSTRCFRSTRRSLSSLGQAEKLRHGAQIKDWHFAPGTYRVYSITGEFLLLGKVENTILTTIKSFFEV